MEQKSKTRAIVWTLVCLAGSAFMYTLGWQQGLDAGQQRGLMQGEMQRAYWDSRAADLRDEAPNQPEDDKHSHRHNASARHDEGR
jgi:hypothetical protein